MSRRKVVILAIGILLGGFCAALPFRHPPNTTTAVSSGADSKDLIITQTLKPETSVSPAPQVDRAPEVSVELNAPAVDPATKSSPPVHSIGAAAPEVTPATPPVPPEATLSALDIASADIASAVPTPAHGQNERPTLRGWRRHRIADGDTLSKLAQRYLGDPARENEIFAYNRDVLTSPEILPIGRWLRIPPR